MLRGVWEVCEYEDKEREREKGEEKARAEARLEHIDIFSL